MDRRKLLLYLALNVVVSACVTGSILFWYDRNYRASLAPAVVPVAANGSGATVAPQTAVPQGDVPMEIVSVVGAGTVSAESVIIRYNGDGQVDLTGWQLKDEEGNTFTFPQLTLYTNGAVQVHTTSGTDTVIDLYWDLPETAIWSSGENARLYDSQGNLQAVYRIP